MNKSKIPRWNWIVSGILGVIGIICEILSAFILFGGTAKMLQSSIDINRVFGIFGIFFVIALLLIEGAAIAIGVVFISLLLWCIDILYHKIKKKLSHHNAERMESADGSSNCTSTSNDDAESH